MIWYLGITTDIVSLQVDAASTFSPHAQSIKPFYPSSPISYLITIKLIAEKVSHCFSILNRNIGTADIYARKNLKLYDNFLFFLCTETITTRTDNTITNYPWKGIVSCMSTSSLTQSFIYLFHSLNQPSINPSINPPTISTFNSPML